jgi:hypothetical protein
MQKGRASMEHKPRPMSASGFVLFLALLAGPAGAAELTVTSTGDSGPGTLRQAILDANADTDADTIVFDISGTGVHTILLASTLPVIVAPVTIDGYTQPGASPNTLAAGNDAVLLIELNGNAMADHGLQLQGAASGGSVLRGLVINGTFLGGPGQAGSAIRLEQSDNNTIAGNFIGTDAAGAVASGSGDGVRIINSSNNLVGGTGAGDRNLISGNSQYGVHIPSQFDRVASCWRILMQVVSSSVFLACLPCGCKGLVVVV